MKNQEEYHEKRLDRLSIFVDAIEWLCISMMENQLSES
jgi:hypothetical protein